jgi:prepilin-type N-terminal cleavage/methylation domain-containing protein
MNAVTTIFSRTRRNGRTSSCLRASVPSCHAARGFTLTEVLVTVGIIVLVVALGVPVFNVLRGSRSSEAGLNVVSAVVGQARTIAVNEGRYAGALFFVDPRNGRTSVAIVTITDPAQDPDPYDKYRGWLGPQATGWPASGAAQDYYLGNVDPTVGPVRLGDRVIRLTQDESASGGVSYAASVTPRTGVPTHIERVNAGYGGAYGRPAVRLWYPKIDQTSSAGNAPKPLGDATVTSGFNNNNWVDSPNRISLYGGTDFTLLPDGVGVQLMVQPLRENSASGTARDQLVSCGVIMFDPTGNMSFRTFTIKAESPLGILFGLAPTDDAVGIPAGIGLLVFDKVAFEARGSTTLDFVSGNGALSQGAVNPANPVGIRFGATVQQVLNNYPADWAAESAEESWLLQNATPFYINRFSGTVSAGN